MVDRGYIASDLTSISDMAMPSVLMSATVRATTIFKCYTTKITASASAMFTMTEAVLFFLQQLHFSPCTSRSNGCIAGSLGFEVREEDCEFARRMDVVATFEYE